jgi:hypothetical protein
MRADRMAVLVKEISLRIFGVSRRLIGVFGTMGGAKMDRTFQSSPRLKMPVVKIL